MQRSRLCAAVDLLRQQLDAEPLEAPVTMLAALWASAMLDVDLHDVHHAQQRAEFAFVPDEVVQRQREALLLELDAALDQRAVTLTVSSISSTTLARGSSSITSLISSAALRLM